MVPARLSIPAVIKENATMEIVRTPLAIGKSDVDTLVLSETPVISRRNIGRTIVKMGIARILVKHLMVLVKVPKTCLIGFKPPASAALST
jgi:hypothetical protein